MNYAPIIPELLRIFTNDNVIFNAPMKEHTSFKIGGPCDILVLAQNKFQIADCITILKDNSIPYFIMGNGSNLLVSDKGIRGIVIKISDKFNSIQLDYNDTIFAEAGVLLSRLSNFAYENSLTGLEFASGIPGTVGGAVYMNAGAYGGEIKDVLLKTEYIDSNGNICILENEHHNFGYRKSIFQNKDYVITGVWFKLEKGNKEEIRKTLIDLNQKRKEKQPLEMPSAGSVFKRPEGYFAGKLIDDCNLRGYSIGGAQISAKHCGFIVNTGNATSEDVVKLIKHIQKTVKQSFGVELETEIKFIGEL